MVEKEWLNEIDNEVRAMFHICRCQQCNKEISQPPLTLLEHGYKHIHHFCDYGCLASWSEEYKPKS